MKKIKFTCPNCQAKLRVPTHLAGISAPCPKCGRKITAPTDLDSIVEEDEPVARPKAGATPGRREVSHEPAPSAMSSAAVAEAPSRPIPAEPRSSHAPVAAPAPAVTAPPAPASAPAPAVSPVPAVTPVPSMAPSVPLAPAVAPAPPVLEEPIIQETILTPPAPQSEVAPSLPPQQLPVLEKTQPIQVSPLPSTLPAPGQRPVQEGGTLPRLDANRGDGAGSAGLEALLAPPSGGSAPTKLHLPRPDELNGQQSPGDFLVPAPTPVPLTPPAPEGDSGMYTPEGAPHAEEIPAALPDSMIPDIADLDMSAPGVSMDELEDPAPLAEFDPVTFEPGEEVAEEPIPLELTAPILPPVPQPAPDFVPQPVPEFVPQPEPQFAQPEISQMFQPPVPDAVPDAVPETAEDFADEEQFRDMELSSGSFINLLSEQNDSEQTAPMQARVEPEPVAPHNDLDDLFEPRSPTAAPNARATASSSQSLEDMFGELPESGEKKKLSTVVMLSMIGAVAIIATVVVIMLINAAGGLTPEITSNQTEITPPPRISDAPPAGSAGMSEASESAEGEVPETIDPAARDRVGENSTGITRSTTTLPGDTSRPVLIADDAPPTNIETPDSPAPVENTPAPVEDAPALSFDERVQQIVNGGGNAGSGMNIIGGEPQSSPLDSLDATIADLSGSAAAAVDDLAGAVEAAGAAPGAAANYNPPTAFPAPGPGDAPLGKTHDLLDAFLRAPDWQSRIPYTFQGESLAPAIEDYYKKWPVTSFERFSLQLFQMEQDVALGGPYWVYLVSTNDLDQGYPVIIRAENGNLKVDWEIYSEFQDQHFVEFQKGAIASPHTFRLVIERVSDYFGSDRDSFSDLGDYLVYQINPPYGDLSEFSEYAFVKKDTDLAKELDEVVGLNDEPLAVILTIEQKTFPHGVKHLEITDYVTEGWFR